jgi:3-hydroxyacyl-[acyl-carrier-protein] dehydratase
MTNINNINDILNMLPHRYPMLLVDRILSVVPGESIIGIKNVTVNEPHFQGHFPGLPIMPGVLIIEAMAQLSGVLAAKSLDLVSGENVFYLLGVDNCKFRKAVTPGDTLVMEVTFEQKRNNFFKFQATAKVGDELAAEASIMAMLKDR